MPKMDRYDHFGAMLASSPGGTLMSCGRNPAPALLLAALFLAPASGARAGDDGGINMGMTGMMVRQAQAIELAAALAGTWTVELGALDVPGGCEAVPAPGPRLWTVSASEADLVVKQAADPTFPALSGYVISDDARGISSAKSTGWSVLLWGAQQPAPGTDGRAAALWLDLRLGADGKLGGTWRHLGWRDVAVPGGGSGRVPCFADFQLTGKR